MMYATASLSAAAIQVEALVQRVGKFQLGPLALTIPTVSI